MATYAYLPIVADRAGACIRTIRVVGRDLSGAALALEVRLFPDQPGAAKVTLTEQDLGEEGIHVAVATVDGLPVSTITLQFDEATMQDNAKTPYGGEAGDASVLAYGLVETEGGTRTIATGPFVALATVYGADGAPTSRPYSGNARGKWSTWSTATLTFSDAEVTIVLDGADALAPLVAEATAQAGLAGTEADRAQVARDEAEAAVAAVGKEYGVHVAASAGIASGYYTAAFDVPAMSIKRVYGQVAGGSGTISAIILADSKPIYGPFNVTPEGNLITGLDIAVPIGATLDVALAGADGGQLAVIVKATGVPA